MIIRGVIVIALLLTASCGEAPAGDTKVIEDTTADVGKAEVAEQKKSIEEAAEAATKLIEADAKAEVDAAAAEQVGQ